MESSYWGNMGITWALGFLADESPLDPETVVVQMLSQSGPTFRGPRTAARQAALSFPVSWSLLRALSTESAMLPSHPILMCCDSVMRPPCPVGAPGTHTHFQQSAVPSASVASLTDTASGLASDAPGKREVTQLVARADFCSITAATVADFKLSV